MKNKNHKLFVALLLLILLLLAGFCYPNQDFASQDAFLHNQGEANEIYAKMCESFMKTFGEDGFPDYYGGCRLNDQGVLTVQLTEDSPSIRNAIYSYAGSSNVTFESVVYNYSKLLTTLGEITDYCKNMMRENGNIPFCDASIDENENRVVIHLLEDKTFEHELLSCLTYPDVCVAITVPEENKGNSVVYSGSQITVGSSYYSAGFRCRCVYNGTTRDCFVTAAHGNSKDDQVQKGNQYGETIGYVRFRQFSGTVDASVVVLDAEDFVPTISYYLTSLATDIYTTAVATNSIIWKEGYNGGKTQGTVISNNAICLYNWQLITNMVRSSYSSVGGDSGGIVYTYVGSSNCIVGITCAIDAFGKSFCCQAKNIIPALGLTLY